MLYQSSPVGSEWQETESVRKEFEGPLRRWYVPCKAVAEWLIALLLLVVTLPLIGCLAALVKLTSSGPAFYCQTRLGKNGRPFRMYKIRSMVHNCEAQTGPIWSLPNDSRVTRVGRFLRDTHLDELPQLLNVLRGEMGLIGPRPERPELVPQIERCIPHYRDRLLVRPGVTGLAQMQLPPDTDLEGVRCKLAYDLYYVRHLNFWLDVRIALGTALSLIGEAFYAVGKLLVRSYRSDVEQTMQIAMPATEKAQVSAT